MKTKKSRFFLAFLVFITGFLSSCSGRAAISPTQSAPVTSAIIADVIAKFRQQIPLRMKEQNIPGLAIAVVDDQGILWEEGFGYTDWDRKTPITPNTLFSIQSMSKSLTATAAMFAAQDGLVDLDAPITTYLPNFTVHSIFEDHPEQKMTLRILLSHTAGYPHDTSYGNNEDHPAVFSFEKHIASISNTWLMFPVGTRYSYSNEDTDLVGYILQVLSGMPFIQYVQKEVLDPLGMRDSTLDFQRVRATSTRAIGHHGDKLPIRPPIDILIIPSGGVWTSAEDMARYLQFHINEGALDGKRLLKSDLAETMYTPPNPAAADVGYALGIYLETRNGARYLQHGGGGFGFTNYMAWYPDLKLGAVVLSNTITPGAYAVSLCEDVLDDIIISNIPLYHQRSIHATQVAPAYPPDTKGSILYNLALRSLIDNKSLPVDAAAQERRSAYAGTYILSGFGFPNDTFDITYSNGKLAYFHQGGESKVNQNGTLTEVMPGLLVSEMGNTFDLRGPVMMVDNYRVVKITPQALPFKIALYTLCAFLFLSTLFARPIRALLKRIREKRGQVHASEIVGKGSFWMFLISVLTTLASIFSLSCLLIIALSPYLVYFPWPHPWPDMLWWQFALFSLPFANLLISVGVAILTVLVLRSSKGFRTTCWYYLVVALAVLAFNGMIIFL
jgi:CubicO group peptidase (beta-lactamase class C family)